MKIQHWCCSSLLQTKRPSLNQLTICLAPLILPVLAWRLLDEERIHRRDLPGYNEYATRVRHRLIPHIC